MASASEVESPDFSQPWKFSDQVLVVEEQRFHVHRAMLAFWSPVFEKMFTSEFQEKDKNEVSLPGKKASEIRELLSLIYPSGHEKSITEENCYFLVKLAHEYQMEAIVTRCEDFMVDKVKTKPNESVLSDFVFAQTLKLEKLKLASVSQAHCLSLEELKNDEVHDKLQPEIIKEIMEGIIARLERESEEAKREAQQSQQKIKSMINERDNCLQNVEDLVKSLVKHASSKPGFPYGRFTDVENNLIALECDQEGYSCECTRRRICNGLCDVVLPLRWLKRSLESMRE